MRGHRHHYAVVQLALRYDPVQFRRDVDHLHVLARLHFDAFELDNHAISEPRGTSEPVAARLPASSRRFAFPPIIRARHSSEKPSDRTTRAMFLISTRG